MKKITLLILPFIFPTIIYSQQPVIRSLKAYSDNETTLPVLIGGEGLTIEFDIQSEFMPNFNIVFRYCNKNWEPYDNIFLQNHGQNIAYDVDVERLPLTVEEAQYHFTGVFPDYEGNVSFPFSGKWMFFITDSQDTSEVKAFGRFYVVYPEIETGVSIKNVLLEDRTYYPLELGRAYDITASFNIPEEMYPAYVTEMEIVENQKLDFPYIVDRTFNTNTRQFYWNGDRKFSFTARDIRPGNEYRQVDLRNHNLFIGKNVKAQIDGVEISRFYKQGRRDLNGGSILTNFRNEYATYLNVLFQIRPPSEITGDIFLVGAFNGWHLMPEYRMNNSGGLYSLTTQLKRGIFDYQYVTADFINDEIKSINWIALEGNFWETRNDYYVFIYYNEPNYGGYDRIIGFKKISSRQ